MECEIKISPCSQTIIIEYSVYHSIIVHTFFQILKKKRKFHFIQYMERSPHNFSVYIPDIPHLVSPKRIFFSVTRATVRHPKCTA